MRGVPRARRAISNAAGGIHLDLEQARGAFHHMLQILRRIIIEPVHQPEARAQGRGNHPRARGRADEREARQVQPHAARVRPLVDDDVEPEVLHRRVEIFLDVLVQPMDLVDEKDITLLQRGQQSRKIARLLDHRAGGDDDLHAHRLRHDVRERGLAQPRRPAEEQML